MMGVEQNEKEHGRADQLGPIAGIQVEIIVALTRLDGQIQETI